MRRIFILALVVCVCSARIYAQKKYYTIYIYNLQQCIDSALRKNMDIRQSQFSAEAAAVNLRQARASQLPTIYGNVEQAANLGRNIDPYTNYYVNRSIGYGSYGINAEITLFSGSSIRNNIRQAEMLANATGKEVEQGKEQIMLNVLIAYLQVLNTEEQLSLTKTQADLSMIQLKQLELKNQKGVVSASQVSDLKGQLLNDNLAIVELQNSLEWYKMELAQHMNIRYDKNMTLVKINVDEMMQPAIAKSEEIYSRALDDFAAINAVELRTRAAEYGVKAAKGLRYPQVFAGSTVQTVYSSSASTISEKIGFSDQFINNRSANLVIGLRVPIVVSSIKNNITLAKINLEESKLQEERIKTEVWKQIERAHVAMTNAYARYQILNNQLEAYRTSFKAAQARFETGVDNSVNYLIAKNNFDRANVNFLRSKYDFILKKKMLEYYQHAR
jgi:outer membrane protein